MPLIVDKDGVIERITFNSPARVERHEYENTWWQDFINTCWRYVWGGK